MINDDLQTTGHFLVEVINPVSHAEQAQFEGTDGDPVEGHQDDDYLNPQAASEDFGLAKYGMYSSPHCCGLPSPVIGSA